MKTDLSKGIDTGSIKQRVKAFGTNEPPQTKLKGCCILFLEALNDLTLIILMVAAVVSTIINWFSDKDHRQIGKFLN